MTKFLKKAHTTFYYSLVLFFFGLSFPLLYYYTRQADKYFKQIVRLRRWISVSATNLAGIHFKIKEEVPIDWSKPYILCPNHTSILDITALTFSCPQQFSFMGKIELLKNPVTRMFFKTIDIAVDRTSRISAFKAFKKADQLAKEGKSIVIFPEGKIDDEYPPRLHEFKSGSFRIALDNKIQILPIVIHDAYEILWDDGGRFGSHPGNIHISILKPIETVNNNLENHEALQDLVYSQMKAHWDNPVLHKIVKKT